MVLIVGWWSDNRSCEGTVEYCDTQNIRSRNANVAVLMALDQ